MKWVTALLVLAAPAAATAQGWRGELDVGLRTLAFRGLQLDTIGRTSLAPGASFTTPDGYAAECPIGSTLCTFYRPGAAVHATPFSARATADAWGFGVPGLRLHVDARYLSDLASAEAWPLIAPAFQLIEGYAEYARSALTVRAGRTVLTSRLGWQGLDGGHADVRLADGRLRVGAWGGWGLAEGVALPVTSDALNPLDEFQPRDRQLVAGADVEWRAGRARGRLVYQREVDPAVNYFISERAAADVDLRPARWASLTGGAEYDMAAGEFGSADAALAIRAPKGVHVSAGARRYRPYFPLWTIWGAFSPSPYHAVFGSLEVPLERGLSAWVRGERYWFASSDATTPFVTVEEDGWRWNGGARWTPAPQLRIEGGVHGAFGPGAAAVGFDGRVTGRVRPDLSVAFQFGRLVRPLELRYQEVELWQGGGEVRWQVRERLRLVGGVLLVEESRARPDAASLSWNQVRAHFGMRVGLGRGADLRSVPPAVMAMPEGS